MQHDSSKILLPRRAVILFLFSLLAFWSGHAFGGVDTCTNGHCCTHTQFGWGAMNGPGSVLASNFNAVYPGGVVEVGLPGALGFSMRFTSAAAISHYLPASGPPGALNADLTDPTNTSSGVFGGEVLALQLNVDFNDAHLIPGTTNCHFGDLKLADPSSPLNGKSVRDILAIANTALGGGDISSNGLTLVQLSQLLEQLNGAFADCVLPPDSPAPISLLELITSNGSLFSGGRKFSNFRFLGDTNVINPANIIVELPTFFESCLGLRFRGGMVATGAVTDLGLLYSVETTNGLPLIDEIGQSFTYSGTGNGGFILIGETVWLNNFFSGFLAQSSIGFTDVMDAPAEPVQGDSLVINPPAAKVWVTKDIILTPADMQSSVELLHVDQVFCGPPVQCCMATPWAMTNLSRCMDTTPPTLTCGSNFMVECGQSWSFTPPMASDNCGNVMVTVLSTVTNGACCCMQTIVRIWTAVDLCGNSNICSQTVTLVDTTPPMLMCAPNRAVECGTPFLFNPPTAFDMCSGTNVTIRIVSTITNTAGFCSNTFSVTRTWEATDPCTNAARCSQTITVQDTTPPMLVCPPDLQLPAGTPFTFGMPMASDSCGPVTVTVKSTTTNILCGNSFMAMRTWVATDACGNMAECTQTITVISDKPTNVICAKNKKVDCDESWNFQPPVVGPGGGQIVIDVIDTVTNQICGSSYSATRTWQITDGCGNMTNCSQTVTVESSLDIDCGPDKTVECGASWEFDSPKVKHCKGDDVDVDIVYTITNDLGNGRHQVIRKWRVKDDCGNEDSCKQIITIVDAGTPVVNCGRDKMVECGSDWKFDAPTNTDNSVIIVGTWTNGTCGSTFTATRAWEASDHCGNRAQCSQTVTIVDTMPPILLKCPTNMVVQCDAIPEPASVRAADPVSAGPGAQILLNSNNIVGGSGTWSNAAWNAANVFNAFHIVDNQTGSISERNPGNFWLGRQDHAQEHIVIDLGKPFVIDRIDLFNTHDQLLDDRRTKDFLIKAGNEATDFGSIGLDLTGTVDLILSNRLTFHLAKNDPIEPDIYTEENGLRICAAYRYLRFESLNGYGNDQIGLNEIRIYGRMVCDTNVTVIFEESRTNGFCPQSYFLTRRWTAIDACGNFNQCTQQITVVDTVAPFVTCPPHQIISSVAELPACPGTLEGFVALGATAIDNCDPYLTYECNDGPIVGTPGNMRVERRHKISDSCGNSTNCLQIFFISEALPPLALPLSSARLSIHVDPVGGWVILQWDAVAGARYCVQYKDDLPNAEWTSLSGEVCPAGSTGVKEDAFNPDRKRFYRVMQMP